MIEVRGLTKRFGRNVAVNDLSFDVPAGVVTGFLGPNGAGKSTTLRMILGLDRPTAGTATISGRAFSELSAPMREVGALLEARAFHPRLSARTHLQWLAQAGGVPSDRADAVLEMVGLADVDTQVGSFSLGMQQRLGIAAALLGDPSVLLFDEPVNGLDPDGIIWVRTLMRDLAGQGRAILVSSHLMGEMQQTADRVVVLGQGCLVADVTVAELTAGLRRSSGVRVVTPQSTLLTQLITDNNGELTVGPDDALVVQGLSAPHIGQIATANDVVLHELSPVSTTLEAAFIELTHDRVSYRATDDATPDSTPAPVGDAAS